MSLHLNRAQSRSLPSNFLTWHDAFHAPVRYGPRQSKPWWIIIVILLSLLAAGCQREHDKSSFVGYSTNEVCRVRELTWYNGKVETTAEYTVMEDGRYTLERYSLGTSETNRSRVSYFHGVVPPMLAARLAQSAKKDKCWSRHRNGSPLCNYSSVNPGQVVLPEAVGEFLYLAQKAEFGIK